MIESPLNIDWAKTMATRILNRESEYHKFEVGLARYIEFLESENATYRKNEPKFMYGIIFAMAKRIAELDPNMPGSPSNVYKLFREQVEKGGKQCMTPKS